MNFIFPYTGQNIIPTDELTPSFFRWLGRKTTNQIFPMIIWGYPLVDKKNISHVIGCTCHCIQIYPCFPYFPRSIRINVEKSPFSDRAIYLMMGNDGRHSKIGFVSGWWIILLFIVSSFVSLPLLISFIVYVFISCESLSSHTWQWIDKL